MKKLAGNSLYLFSFFIGLLVPYQPVYRDFLACVSSPVLVFPLHASRYSIVLYGALFLSYLFLVRRKKIEKFRFFTLGQTLLAVNIAFVVVLWMVVVAR